MESFDDFETEQSGDLSDYKPFQFREDKTEEGTLKWLNENFNYLYMGGKPRLMSYRRFSNRYKNLAVSGSTFIRTQNRDAMEVDMKPKVRTNFFYSYVEQKVSQVSRQKQNPVFIPLNDTEVDDLNNAEACTALVRFRMKELNFNALMREQDRKTFKYGTSFAKIYWDDCSGPVNPKYDALKKKHGKIPRLDEKGKKTNEEVSEYEAKLGDVVVEIVDTDSVFVERKKKKWEKVDFCEHIEFVPLSELQAEYGDDLKKEEYYWLDIENKGFNEGDQICKHTFYHRPTKYLPAGEVIIYIEGKILERITDPEKVRDIMPSGELPFVADFDVEVDDEFWARPFLVNIEQLNNLHDLVQSGMARNIGVASHPKIAVPQGSVNLKQLNNEFGIVQYTGQQAPQWIQHNYVNKGEFEIQDRLEKKMDLMAKVYDVSKGTVPPGVTAFSAIRYLDDQEIQANSTTIEKRRERVKKIYWMVLKFMDRHYKKGDESRMIHILGDNNSYQIKSFKKFDFGKIYGVDIENISALSDTRSGKISDIVDINAANQKNPTFGPKEISKILDLGLEKGFQEELSFAPMTARSILEMLKNGEVPPAPEPTDDLIEMYTIFSRFVESLSYKTKLDKARKTNIQNYIKGMEYLMMNQAQKNQAFGMLLRAFPKYPMFYKPGAVVTGAPMAMPGQAPVGGAPQAPAAKGAPFAAVGEKANQETQNGGEEV